MSRLFDAIRRAEVERRERASGRAANEETRGPEMPESAPRGTERPAGVSSGLLRELGMLRNAIDVALAGKKKKSLLFTSAMEEEGTTTIAAGFARLLALGSRERVLLCEMNARAPSFSSVFPANDGAGVTDYFVSDASLQSLVQKSDQDGLDLLYVGRQDATVIQLNLKRAFPRLLEEALRMYDTVVVDAPPVMTYPETPPMTAFVDGVVMVVHAGKTKREVVQRAFQSIAGFEGTVLGVVLNRKRYHIPSFLYRRI